MFKKTSLDIERIGFMRKIIICIITSLILIFTASYVAFATDTDENIVITENSNVIEIIASGICGDDLTWELNSEGLLTISGTGDMYDYTEQDLSPWSNYIDAIISLEISSEVTSIGDYSFYRHEKLSGKLSLPKGIESIGGNAFGDCNGLTGDLVIPDSVTIIEGGAFENCDGFEGGLELPANLSSIGNMAFYRCDGFTGNLVIPESVDIINESVFYGCKGFDGSLIIPNNVTLISNSAFRDCNGFNGELILSDSLTEIGAYAFSGCTGFTGELVLPEGLTKIGWGAFEDCAGFTGKLVLPRGIEEINGFSGCSGFIGDLLIPEGVKRIGGSAFKNCSGFEGDLIIPNTVTEIGNSAFSGCSNLSGTLSIPEGISAIEYNAFSGCAGFTGDLIIPNNIKEINQNAFESCTGFDGKLVLPEGLIKIGWHAFEDCSGFTGTLTVPASLGQVSSYAFDGCSGFTKLQLPEGIVAVGTKAFSGCTGFVGELVLPNSLKTISDYAFYNCSGFSGVLNLHDNICSIEDYAFAGCSGFTGDLDLPDGTTQIGDAAFKDCTGFSGTLTLPTGLKDIGYRAFSGCDGLVGKLIFPETVKTIGSSAFYGCSGLTGEVSLPNSLETISAYTFYGCSGIIKIITGNGVINIENNVFESCNNLKNIVLGNNVASISEKAFNGCPNLIEILVDEDNVNYESNGGVLFNSEGKIIKYPIGKTESSYIAPDNTSEVGSYAFYNCDNLKSILLPNGVIGIGNYAFYDCDKMAKVELSDSLTNLGEYSFAGCESIREISFPEDLPYIGEHAFLDCVNLAEAYLGKGVVRVKNGAFRGCIALKSINLEKVMYIDGEAFRGCVALKNIDCRVLENLGAYTFYECEALETVILSDNVSEIKYNTFENCTNLTLFVIGTGMEVINFSAFKGCPSINTFHYRGTEEEWDGIIKNGGIAGLTNRSVHYQCDYKSADATITDKGHTYGLYCNECGWLTGEEIEAKEFKVEEIGNFEYTGEAIEPKINITQGQRILEEGKDYEVVYSNNINVGTAEVEIKGAGEFSGVVTKTFDIIPKDLTGLVKWELASWDLSWCELPLFGSTEYIENNLTITLDGNKLVPDKDYNVCSVGYNSERKIASSFNVIFLGNYKGELVGYCLEVADVKAIPDQHYTGSELRPTLVVNKSKGYANKHIEGVDYRVEYSNNIEMGTATVKLFSLGDCYGSTEATFEITDHEYYWKVDEPATIDNDGIKSLHCYDCGLIEENIRIPRIGAITFEKRDYTGKDQTPPATIKDIDGNIISKENAFVGYPVDGLKVGRYKAIAYFMGDYTGRKDVYFVITPKAPKTASAKLRTVTGGYDDVKFSWSKSTGASGYYVYFKKSTAKEYTYLIRTTATSCIKKNLTDGVKYYFKVVPYYKNGDIRYKSASYKTASVYTLKKISTPKLSKSGTKVKVKWTNINGETGYQISKSTKKAGTNIVSTYKTTKGKYKTVKATKGKRYYYKVRAYKVVDGKKVYGPWSAVKSYKR